MCTLPFKKLRYSLLILDYMALVSSLTVLYIIG